MNTQNDNPLEDLDTSTDEESQNQADNTENEDTEDSDTDESEENSEDNELDSLRKENKTLRKQKDHWRTKAQQGAGAEEESGQSDNISQKDMYSLIKADVHEDDFDAVIEYAQFKRISIPEALRTRTLKNILKESDEIRATEQAKNTSRKRSGNKGQSDESLKNNLSKGDVPEVGSKEAEDLFWARRGGRRN